MTTITASQVNDLRKQTGAGMMDCKKALIETNGDFDKAIDNLRKKGQKVAAKRADRETTEGVVLSVTNSEFNDIFLAFVTCTDFSFKFGIKGNIKSVIKLKVISTKKTAP